MALFSWFNAADQVDAALVYVAVIGAVIELGVAIAAVINVHKEIEESRKRKLEKYIEIFACLAAFFFLAEAILGWRSSMLLAKELETLKSDNLKHEQQVEELRSNNIVLAAKQMPRTINATQMEGFKFLTQYIQKKPIKISIGLEGFDTETYASQMREMFTYAGFGTSADCGAWGIFRDSNRFERRMLGETNEPFFVWIIYNGTNNFAGNQVVQPNYTITMAASSNTNFPSLPVIIGGESPETISYAIEFALLKIGIPTALLQNNYWEKPGEFEIFIPLKNL